MHLKIRTDKSFFEIGAIIFALGFYHINVLFNSIISLLIGQNSVDSMIIYGLLIYFAVGFIVSHVHIYIDEFLLIAFILIEILVTRIFWSNNWVYLNDIIPEIFQGILVFVVFRRVKNLKNIEKGIHILAYIIFVDAIILALVSSGVILKDVVSVTYMAYGYNTLPAVLIFLYRALTEKKKTFFVYSILIILLILLYGSRGTIIAIAGFVFIYFVFVERELTRKKVFLITGIVVFSVVINNNMLLRLIANALSSITTFESRTLSMLFSGNMMADSGRNYIYEGCIDLINRNWLFGTGICGERTQAFIYQPNLGVIKGVKGLYAHNFFLEVLIDFGLPIGILFISYILIKEIKVCICKDKNIQKIGIILFSGWFFQHMVSGTFWTSTYFFATLAFAMVWNKKKRAGGD